MIKSVCGYCGVGCGIEYDTKSLIGDIAYPTNEGLVCAKGVSELHTIATSSRLLRPSYKTQKDRNHETVSWDFALDLIASKLKSKDPKKIAFYLSGQLLTEDYYVANKLAKGFLGTSNIDTNSRTCMASAVVAHKKVFGIDYVLVSIQDIKYCDLLILVGANPAEAHVVFWNKIKKELKRGMKLIVIDPRKTETAKYADLHIPIKVGTDIDFLSAVAKKIVVDNKLDLEFITNYTNDYEAYLAKIKKLPITKLLKRANISKELFEKFLVLLYQNQNVISAWTMGLNQSSQGVDKNIALINLHLLTGKINKAGNGPFSLTGQPNAMGGREVGGFSTMLAVHLEFEEQNIQRVREFWNAPNMATTNGLTAYEIFEEAYKGNIDVLIISHTDPIYHLPNRTFIEEAIKRIPFVVEINAYQNSQTATFAHLRLPAAPWGEKEGTQTNMDRTITRQEKLTRTSIDCKADWEIFCLIAKKLGFEKSFSYENTKNIFDEYKEMTKLSPNGHLNIYECGDLKEHSFVWGKNLFENNKFLTQNKKANMILVSNKLLSEMPTSEYPFLLITGRTRDQWHSGTKTAFVERLLKYKPQKYIEINPQDAKKYGIEENEMVVISTKRGAVTLAAMITDDIPKGVIFVPITFTDINYLTNDLLDTESKQPDYNHNAAKLERL